MADIDPDGATAALAGFACGVGLHALPDGVTAKIRELVLDCLGNQIGAYGEASAHMLYAALEVEGSWALEDLLTGERYEGEGVVRVPVAPQSVRMLRVASVRTPRSVGARSEAPAQRGATG